MLPASPWSSPASDISDTDKLDPDTSHTNTLDTDTLDTDTLDTAGAHRQQAGAFHDAEPFRKRPRQSG